MKLKEILIYRFFHRILSTNKSSAWVGRFSNTTLNKTLLKLIIKLYIWFFEIDMSEYDFDISKVTSFNEFFTRQLKSDARIWGEGICSPVDGKMLSYGPIEEGQIFQVKGMNYSESQLSGQQAVKEGSFVNLYLSPANYHRVHAPFDMKIEKVTHIPGKLLSVSKKNAETVDELYLKNERLVLSGSSEYGLFHFVFVGALNVGSIKLSFLPEIKTNIKNARHSSFDVNYEVSKSRELGYFEMGSTVIMILQSQSLDNIDPGFLKKEILLGESLV